MFRRLLVSTAAALLAATGVAGAQERIKPRIVDGDVVQTTGDYPWQVGLTGYDGGGQYCGGTLIASKFVLTAEHCEPTTNEFVHVGSLGRASGGEYIGIAAVRRHPRSDNSGNVPRYDVNILELEQPVSAQYDKPLAIADPATETGLWANGQALTVTGWGDTSDGGVPSSTLLVAQVPRIADSTCGSIYGSQFSSTDMVCAGGGTTDTCQGDSGGPLAAPAVASPSIADPADWRLVGVTSWGAACATPGVPGVYARISSAGMYDWTATTSAVPGTASLSGTPAVGQTLTCSTSGWTGGSSYRRWQFLRDGAAGAIQHAATTNVTLADKGRTIACVAVGDNGAGQTATSASNGLAVPADQASDVAPTVTPPVIFVPAPAPVAAPAPAATPPAAAATPTTAPAGTPRAAVTTSVGKITRSCKQRRCTFTITSDAAGLKLTLKRRRTTATIYRAKAGKNGTFTVRTGRLRKGRYVVTVTGAATAKKLSFRV